MKIKFKHCRRKRIRKFFCQASMESNGQTSIRYSQLLHIWFTLDVSGICCPDI